MKPKESYFIFNSLLYKQTDGVVMGSPLGPSLTNAFLSYHEKNWLNNWILGIHLVKENVPTVKKKHLLLVFPYLGIISLQTRTKIQQALKGVLNCFKIEIVFKYQTRFSNSFRYKDPIPKDLISGVVH